MIRKNGSLVLDSGSVDPCAASSLLSLGLKSNNNGSGKMLKKGSVHKGETKGGEQGAGGKGFTCGGMT